MAITGGGDRGALALILPWVNDNSAAVWGLVYPSEEQENYQKQFGKVAVRGEAHVVIRMSIRMR